MGEPAHGVDGLIGQVVIGGSIVLDKLAILHVESLLTSTGNSVLDTARMPGSDTSDLAKTLVGLDWHFLFKMLASKINFVANTTAIELDFNNVRLLLTSSQQLLLGVADHTNNGAIFLDLIEVFLNFFLANVIFPFQTGLGKSLLLGLGPILVESTFALNIDMLSPNC